MRVGSLVLMVRDIRTPLDEEEIKAGCKYPIKGRIYTVRAIIDAGETYIQLEEIVNPKLPYRDYYGEMYFYSKYFIEILEPMDIISFIEENTLLIPSTKDIIKKANELVDL